MKSVKLSLICTKIVIVLVVLSGAFLPYLLKYASSYMDYYLATRQAIVFIALIYVSCIFALTALFFLHKLLTNIRDEFVFIDMNVKLLRRISWCCFGAAAVMAVATPFFLVFFFVAVMLAFMGLILRVVKNVIEAAVTLKTENDLTI